METPDSSLGANERSGTGNDFISKLFPQHRRGNRFLLLNPCLKWGGIEPSVLSSTWGDFSGSVHITSEDSVPPTPSSCVTEHPLRRSPPEGEGWMAQDVTC